MSRNVKMSWCGLQNEEFHRFSAKTVRVMNYVSKMMTPDDPAVIVEILDIDMLDAAMGLASSPFPVIGTSPLESEQIFRNWIIHQANGVLAARHHVPIVGSLAFHRLSDVDMENFLQAITIFDWEREIDELGLAGFAIVWKMSANSALFWDRRAFHR